MELKHLPADAAELRSIIMAASMTSCYMILEEMAAHRDLTVRYEDFRQKWIDLYKSVHKVVAQWKPRETTR
jgi:thiaminase